MSTRQLRNAFCLFNAFPGFIPCLLVVLLISGCSSGSSGGSSSSRLVTTETVTLGNVAKNVQIVTGVTISHAFTYTFPGDTTKLGDFSINVIRTLENVTLSSAPIASSGSKLETLRLLAFGLVKEAFAAATAKVEVHISYAGDPDVCSSPYIGSDNILAALGSPPTGSKTSYRPNQEVVDIINAGVFELCVVTTPPIDAYVTVKGVVADFEACPPAASGIAGKWSGSYQCTNYGTPNDGGPVSLTITQNADGSYQYVDDGGAVYDGHLCGSKFKFKGGTSFYTESGTMVFSGSNATKTSRWLSASSIAIGGKCSDVLQRM